MCVVCGLYVFLFLPPLVRQTDGSGDDSKDSAKGRNWKQRDKDNYIT